MRYANNYLGYKDAYLAERPLKFFLTVLLEART